VAALGLFPLGIVLLPTERIPLHIFEERYKELIGECLDEGGDFGLVLGDDDGLREIGTRATVLEVLSEFDDGRLNVVIEGGERFRILELTEGRSFQTADEEPIEDEDEDEAADAEEASRALDLFRRVAALTGADVEEPEPETESLSFALAGRVDFAAEVKQELLELRSEHARLTRLSELLEQAARTLAREREASERASGNGHVAPRGDG
jgi:Lon protease-like protein